jgi:hypothetical protein
MSIFEQLSKEYESGGIAAALAAAESQLRSEKRYHELFEILKMRSRQSLGLPLLHEPDRDVSDEAQRSLEDGLLSSCRDVGFALLGEGQIQDSWVYLRHLDENEVVLKELQKLDVTEENLEQVLGLLLHEGLDCEAGYAMVLEHHGTCNAITTMQQALYNRSKPERQAAGRLLVAHVHNELLENVKAHVEREEKKAPEETRISALTLNRDFLFADGAYHIDTSHLSSTIQVAGELTDKPSIELALDMAEYGQKLEPGLQYPGDPPFEELYPTYHKFFSAQLGNHVDTTLAHFRDRAKTTDAHQEGTFAIETYIDLLARIGRADEAIRATTELIPAGIQTTGRAPSFYDLSEQLGDFSRYRELCADRNDMLGYVISLEK